MSELEALTVDLPSAAEPRRGRRRSALEASVRIHLTVYIIVNAMLIGIWAASGGGYFWPIWPILGWGMGIAGHAAPIIAGVGRRSRHRRSPPPRTPPPPSRPRRAPSHTSLDHVAPPGGAPRPRPRP